jgi:ketosteroid isomerase-like protein
MASANVDLVRSIYAAWERGDWSSVEWAHPEIEYVWADGPSPGTFEGLAGMARAMREMLSAWEQLSITAERYREVDDERVLVFDRFGGRGKASAIEAEQLRGKGANLFHVRDGQVTRLASYWDRDRALADLGLSPEADSA